MYTSELDSVVFHDVGPKRIPTAHYWDNEEKKLLAVQTDKVCARRPPLVRIPMLWLTFCLLLLCVWPIVGVQVNVVKSDTGKAAKSGDAASLLDDIPIEVITFFATPEDGIIVQVSFQSSFPHNLLALLCD